MSGVHSTEVRPDSLDFPPWWRQNGRVNAGSRMGEYARLVLPPRGPKASAPRSASA